MSQEEKILEMYREGDADQRLSLFLSYRDLRDDFMAVEMHQPEFAEVSPQVEPQETEIDRSKKWMRLSLTAIVLGWWKERVIKG